MPGADGCDEPGISVQDHCVNVGAVAAELLNRLPWVPWPRGFLVWLAGCHDVGKISPGFQIKCPAWLTKAGLTERALCIARAIPEPDHSKVSQFSIQHYLRDHLAAEQEDAALWAAIVGMHHGSPHFKGEWSVTERLAGTGCEDWESRRCDLIAWLLGEFGGLDRLPEVGSACDPLLWWAAGFITVADWIGSDERFFPAGRVEGLSDPALAAQRACEALDRVGFRMPVAPPARGFEELFGFRPNDLQEAAMTSIREPGIYVIEAPMGLGKTEAALAASFALLRQGTASGLYFALPTQATSNRIHERVAAFLRGFGGSPPRLIHSASWLLDRELDVPVFSHPAKDEHRSSGLDWFASGKRALLAPFGVGTVDQALLGVVAVRHFFVRHLALAGKVVILDEVHSYDVYTGSLIIELIRALVRLRCTVIILSATLTTNRRERLLLAGPTPCAEDAPVPAGCAAGPEPFPLITGRTLGGRSIRHPVPAPPARPPVAIHFRQEREALSRAVEAAESGACVLWICNTVDRAIATYRAVRSETREGGPPTGLLHSRFPFFLREKLEGLWMTRLGKDRGYRPRGCVLVSTQIVEQSVDLDADLLVTELAPTDMLFQRLGRLWRHHGPGEAPRPVPRPEVWILQESLSLAQFQQAAEHRRIIEALGPKAFVYSPYVLLRSLEQWHGRGEVRLPQDIRPWLEATYQERTEPEPPAWQALQDEMARRQKKHLGMAHVSQKVWGTGMEDVEGAATRLGDCPTIPVLIASEISPSGLVLLDGSTIAVRPGRPDLEFRRACHRNLVRLPAHWFHRPLNADLPRLLPAWLSRYIRGEFEVAVLRQDVLESASLGKLRFCLDSGPERVAGARPPVHEDDEPAYD